MKSRITSLAASACLLAATVSSQATIVVYDNLDTAATAGTSALNSTANIYGDALNLTQGGVLSAVGLSIFNSSSGGNTGSILTGTTVVKFFDNTVPYSGGALTGALLGIASLTWDFTADPLLVGFFATQVFDVAGLGIYVPQNILITQQFTQTTGTSLRNGVVLFSDPVVGSSPANVYLKSTTTAEGFYTYTNNPNQFGYYLEIVPEPGVTASLAGVGLLALAGARRFWVARKTR